MSDQIDLFPCDWVKLLNQLCCVYSHQGVLVQANKPQLLEETIQLQKAGDAGKRSVHPTSIPSVSCTLFLQPVFSTSPYSWSACHCQPRGMNIHHISSAPQISWASINTAGFLLVICSLQISVHILPPIPHKMSTFVHTFPLLILHKCQNKHNAIWSSWFVNSYQSPHIDMQVHTVKLKSISQDLFDEWGGMNEDTSAFRWS